jgi:hypothetical protein
MIKRVKLAKAEATKQSYVEEPKERAAIQKPLSRMVKNTTPRLKMINDKISIDHPDPITAHLLVMEALGTGDADFMHGILGQLAGVTGRRGRPPSDTELNFLFSVVKDIKPRDHIDAMLATQMAAVHRAAMRSAQDLARAENMHQEESAERIFSKLTRTFLAQIEALKRHRGSGEQSVTVQNVSVQDGDHTIVRNPPITAGKTATSPLAITDARTVPMPLLDNREPELALSPLNSQK